MPRWPNARPEQGSRLASGGRGRRDGAWIETLTSEECRRLLAGASVGRLGVVQGGFPLILPVNYGMHGDHVVVRTDPGTKFSAARQRRVSFEIDRMDPSRRTGWSVLVQGFGVEVAPDDDRYDEYEAVPVEPWAPGERSRILLVTPISVTGRRIRRPPGPSDR